MVKIIGSLLLALFISFAAKSSADQIDIVIDMSVNQMKQDPSLNGVISCLGVSESSFIQAFRTSMRHCMSKFGFEESAEQAMNSCFEVQFTHNLGVNDSLFARCEAEHPDDDSEVEPNETDIDYSNKSDQQISTQIQLEQQRLTESMKPAIAISRALSDGSEDQITLPVYPSSVIVSHSINEITNEDTPTAIPVAVFYSSDSLAKISIFYDNHLARFDKKVFDSDFVVYMQNMPSDLELLTDIEYLQNAPHIVLYSFIDEYGTKKTSIEIAYQK